MSDSDQLAFQRAQSVARESYGKLIAILSKRTRDVAQAEDLLAEAFAAALESWPHSNVPDNPQGWLIAVAKRKHVDALRKAINGAAAVGHLQLLAEELAEMTSIQKSIPDDRLALMFACAHPAIDADIRSPLILQTVLGMTAQQIAAAFLVAPSTMGQRLARAKAKIKLAGIPFRIPDKDELAERLDAVLEAVYATFNRGWTRHSTIDNNLAEEALWFGALVIKLTPDEPECLGLMALMLFLQSRHQARRSDAGAFVPLDEQDLTKWDAELISQAESLLLKASAMNKIGRFQLEAAIQSVHAARRITGFTDWVAIESFYEALYSLTASPVVKLNWAYATSQSISPEAGLSALPDLNDWPELVNYQPYYAVRADLLLKCGHPDESDKAFDKAIALEMDIGIRNYLIKQKALISNRLLQ